MIAMRGTRTRDTESDWEEEKMTLENKLLENKVIAERLEILKKYEITELDIQVLLNGLINRPLGKLDAFQDKNIISDSSLRFIENGDGQETNDR